MFSWFASTEAFKTKSGRPNAYSFLYGKKAAIDVQLADDQVIKAMNKVRVDNIALKKVTPKTNRAIARLYLQPNTVCSGIINFTETITNDALVLWYTSRTMSTRHKQNVLFCSRHTHETHIFALFPDCSLKQNIKTSEKSGLWMKKNWKTCQTNYSKRAEWLANSSLEYLGANLMCGWKILSHWFGFRGPIFNVRPLENVANLGHPVLLNLGLELYSVRIIS